MAPRVESRHTHCACDNFEKCMHESLCVWTLVYMWMCVVFLFYHSLLQAGALNKNVLLVIQCGSSGIRKTNVFACFFFYFYALMPCTVYVKSYLWSLSWGMCTLLSIDLFFFISTSMQVNGWKGIFVSGSLLLVALLCSQCTSCCPVCDRTVTGRNRYRLHNVSF